MPTSKIVLLITVILSMAFVSSCCKNDNGQNNDNKVIAKINNYTLDTADFKSEVRKLLPGNLSEADFEKAKEGLLDDIITKKILIQEAQKENFDKDRAFTREIEKYWEQALLKFLFKKKEQELLSQIKIDEGGEGIRNEKVQQALNAWIGELKSRADIKKYKENLKAVRP